MDKEIIIELKKLQKQNLEDGRAEIESIIKERGLKIIVVVGLSENNHVPLEQIIKLPFQINIE
jgi:cupin superfamily acireductone dioxygenase involved in methionine salvage